MLMLHPVSQDIGELPPDRKKVVEALDTRNVRWESDPPEEAPLENDVEPNNHDECILPDHNVPPRSDWRDERKARDRYKAQGERIAPEEQVEISATPWEWREPSTLEPRQRVYGSHYIRGFVTATVAPTKLGKSSLIMAETIAMTTGRDLLGVAVRTEVRVWYFNGEDPNKELDLRLSVICKHFKGTKEDIGGRLFVDSGRDKKFVIARTTKAGVTVVEPVVKAMIAEIQSKKIDVLIIDPFISCHEVPENDNDAIDIAVKKWAYIADVCNISIELVHHTRKNNGAGELTSDDARGGSSFVGAVRSCRVLNVMSSQEATNFGISQRRRFFRVDTSGNMLVPTNNAVWRQIVSVDAENGKDGKDGKDRQPSDSVGVVEAWAPPEVFEGMRTADLVAVQKAVSARQWRHSVQANDWVGKVVAQTLGLILEDKDDKEKRVTGRVKEMIRIWIKNGALTVVSATDTKSRKSVEYVEVGQWVTEGVPEQ
jgi:hypothetical protein